MIVRHYQNSLVLLMVAFSHWLPLSFCGIWSYAVVEDAIHMVDLALIIIINVHSMILRRKTRYLALIWIDYGLNLFRLYFSDEKINYVISSIYLWLIPDSSFSWILKAQTALRWCWLGTFQRLYSVSSAATWSPSLYFHVEVAIIVLEFLKVQNYPILSF